MPILADYNGEGQCNNETATGEGQPQKKISDPYLNDKGEPVCEVDGQILYGYFSAVPTKGGFAGAKFPGHGILEIPGMMFSDLEGQRAPPSKRRKREDCYI